MKKTLFPVVAVFAVLAASAGIEDIHDPELKREYAKQEKFFQEMMSGKDEATTEKLKQAMMSRLARIEALDKDPAAKEKFLSRIRSVAAHQEETATRQIRNGANNDVGVGGGQGVAKSTGPEFTGICGLDLGEVIEVSTLSREYGYARIGVQTVGPEACSDKAATAETKGYYSLVGNVVPKKGINGFTKCECRATIKTHRLFRIDLYSDKNAKISSDPRFTFDSIEKKAPAIVSAVEKKYGVSAISTSNAKYLNDTEYPFQWYMQFPNERSQAICLSGAYLGYGARIVAIDERIAREALAESEEYEKEEEAKKAAKGAADSAEAADAL